MARVPCLADCCDHERLGYRRRTRRDQARSRSAVRVCCRVAAGRSEMQRGLTGMLTRRNWTGMEFRDIK